MRYVAPTSPIYVHGSWTAGSRETRRDETKEEARRRVVFRGSHGSASTWIMPVPVRPTRTCPWNSRSRARLDASLRSEPRLRPRFAWTNSHGFFSGLSTNIRRAFYQSTQCLSLPIHLRALLTRLSNFRYPRRTRLILCGPTTSFIIETCNNELYTIFSKSRSREISISLTVIIQYDGHSPILSQISKILSQNIFQEIWILPPDCTIRSKKIFCV